MESSHFDLRVYFFQGRNAVEIFRSIRFIRQAVELCFLFFIVFLGYIVSPQYRVFVRNVNESNILIFP